MSEKKIGKKFGRFKKSFYLCNTKNENQFSHKQNPKVMSKQVTLKALSYVALSAIKDAKLNLRSVDADHVSAIKNDIFENGYRNSSALVISQDGELFDGHHRFYALSELAKDGLIADELINAIPVVVIDVDGLSDREKELAIMRAQFASDKDTIKRGFTLMDIGAKIYKSMMPPALLTIEECAESIGQPVQKTQRLVDFVKKEFYALLQAIDGKMDYVSGMNWLLTQARIKEGEKANIDKFTAYIEAKEAVEVRTAQVETAVNAFEEAKQLLAAKKTEVNTLTKAKTKAHNQLQIDEANLATLKQDLKTAKAKDKERIKTDIATIEASIKTSKQAEKEAATKLVEAEKLVKTLADNAKSAKEKAENLEKALKEFKALGKPMKVNAATKTADPAASTDDASGLAAMKKFFTETNSQEFKEDTYLKEVFKTLAAVAATKKANINQTINRLRDVFGLDEIENDDETKLVSWSNPDGTYRPQRVSVSEFDQLLSEGKIDEDGYEIEPETSADDESEVEQVITETPDVVGQSEVEQIMASASGPLTVENLLDDDDTE